MRCLGFTKKVRRCKIECKKWYYPFCPNHIWQPIIMVFITIPSLLGVYAGVFRDLLEPLVSVKEIEEKKDFSKVNSIYEAVDFPAFFIDCNNIELTGTTTEKKFDKSLCAMISEIRKNSRIAKSIRESIHNRRLKFNRNAIFITKSMKHFIANYSIKDKAYVVEVEAIYSLIGLYLKETQIVNGIVSRSALMEWNDESKLNIDDIIYLIGVLNYYLVVEVRDNSSEEFKQKNRSKIDIAFEPLNVIGEIKLNYFKEYKEDFRGEGEYSFANYVWR